MNTLDPYWQGKVLPDLSHYTGQRATTISYGEEDWEWGLELESGVVVRNFDQRRTTPPEVKGDVFIMMTLSEDQTILKMGEGLDVVLTPTQYSLSVPDAPPIFPQRREDDQDITPPYPEERIWEGPVVGEDDDES